MTLTGEMNLLDQFAHTEQDQNRILDLDNKKEKEKIGIIEETHCTIVTVGGKFLDKKRFIKVMEKIDEIRKIIRKHVFRLIIIDTVDEVGLSLKSSLHISKEYSYLYLGTN